MSGMTMNALYDTCKQQINTPSNIYDSGQIICRIIQQYHGEREPTISKIQSLILQPARNLLNICNFQDNLFKIWELPSLSQGLQTVKNTCDVLPILSAINLMEPTLLKHLSYIKTPINFIQSSCSLKSSIEAVLPSVKLSQKNKLYQKNKAIQNLLESLKKADRCLRQGETQNLQNGTTTCLSEEDNLYKVCCKLQELIPQISPSTDSQHHKALEILNRMILNSDDINKKLSPTEISKIKEILSQVKKKEDCTVEALLQEISNQFKAHLDVVDDISTTKSLLEVLKCAISWILGAYGILNLFVLGAAVPGTVLLSLEICSFIIRLTISFYKNYLASM